MTVLKWMLIATIVVVVAVAVAGQLGMLSGRAPSDLGVRDGRLKAPSLTPNSVSSQASLYPDHPQRKYADIAPLPVTGSGPETMQKLRRVVEAMPRTKVVKYDPGYLYATFTTPTLQFVDDVEFWFDPIRGVVQVRSASRLGRSDLGLNRARVEEIRTRLASAG